MYDWFVTVLVSVRDVAAKNGMPSLAEEMDAAILIAANDCLDREMADLGTVDVRASAKSAGTTERDAGRGVIFRHH